MKTIVKNVSALMDETIWWSLSLSIAVTCLLAIVIQQKRIYSYWSSRGVPGPLALPFVGNNLNDLTKPLHLLDEWMTRKYGRVVGFYNMSTPFLLVTDVQLINEITTKKFTDFSDRRDFNEHKVLTKFVSALQGEEWRRVRSFISPAFSSGKLRPMTRLMMEPVDRSCKEIGDLCGSGESTEIEVRKYMCGMTLDITIRGAFGVETEMRKNPVVMSHSMKVLQISAYRTFLANVLPQSVKKWMSFSILPTDSIEFMTSLARSIILKRMHNSEQATEKTDFVQIMIQALDGSCKSKSPLTMDEATSNCLLMLIAGFESTASLLTFATFCLAHHPNVQDKLRRGLTAQLIDFDNDLEAFSRPTGGLEYLDCVINETLRLHPPATRMERIARQKVHLSNGLTLDAGTVIALPIYALQRDPSYWDKADSFIPERFAPENKSKLTAHAFMPFGEGPRNCVGMRFALIAVRVALAKLLLQFEFTPSPMTSWPLHFPKATYLLSANNVHVNVRPLQTK